LAGQARVILEEGKVVEIVEYQNMAGIKLSGSPHHVRIVCIRDDVALVRAAVHSFGEGVGDAKQQPARVATVPGNLQRVVRRASDVIRFADGPESLVWSNEVYVGRRVCSSRRQGRLVDIRFALKVQASARHVSNAHQRLPKHLAFERDVPSPGLWVLE